MNMYTLIYAYMHILTLTYIDIHLHTLTYTYLHSHTLTYTLIHSHSHKFIYTYIHLHTFSITLVYLYIYLRNIVWIKYVPYSMWPSHTTTGHVQYYLTCTRKGTFEEHIEDLGYPYLWSQYICGLCPSVTEKTHSEHRYLRKTLEVISERLEARAGLVKELVSIG